MRITTDNFKETVTEVDIKLFGDHADCCEKNDIELTHQLFTGEVHQVKTCDLHLSDNRISGYKGIELSSTTDNIAMNLCFALEGCNHYFYHNSQMKDEATWQAGEYNVWIMANTEGYSRIEPENHIHFVEIMLSDHFFKRMTTLYPSYLEEAYNRFIKGESFTLSNQNLRITPQVERILRELHSHHHMGNATPLYLEAKTLELLSYFMLDCEQTNIQTLYSTKQKGDQDKLYAARDILLENYKMPPSLHQLATMSGTNEYKLKAGFKELFGNTVYGLLFDYRMEKAVSYLLDSDLPIQEIASHSGYEHQAHFTNAFKRKFGITPTDYRKKASRYALHTEP